MQPLRVQVLDALSRSQKSAADCTGMLTPAELFGIELIGKSAVDFGIVSYGSVNTVPLTLSNTLPRCISVAVFSTARELARCWPAKQIIQPGSTGTINVVLSDLTPKTVSC